MSELARWQAVAFALTVYAAAGFACKNGWSDDFCPPEGSPLEGCKPYALLPQEPNWNLLQEDLVRSLFGKQGLPARAEPDDIDVVAVDHFFQGCDCFVNGKCQRADCSKTLNITHLTWNITEVVNSSYTLSLTSNVYVTLNTSGLAPDNSRQGGWPEEPHMPEMGDTLVIYHQGHVGTDCGTYGDSDGVVDWLNQMGYDVANIDMPFKECNSPRYRSHDWFKQFADQGAHVMRFFLEPAVLTINWALSRGYKHVVMAGLSGGGWTTTVLGAIDARLALTIPIAGSIPCDFRHTSWDYEQFCDDDWAMVANYTALYVLAAREVGRTSVQVLHEADNCCFHACGRHPRIQAYNRYVRSQVQGQFRTIVTEGNVHEVNPRDKVVLGSLIQAFRRGWALDDRLLDSPFNLLESVRGDSLAALPRDVVLT